MSVLHFKQSVASSSRQMHLLVHNGQRATYIYQFAELTHCMAAAFVLQSSITETHRSHNTCLCMWNE